MLPSGLPQGLPPLPRHLHHLQKKDEPPDDIIAQKPEKEKILTEKKPYRMDDLLEGMREMEDMMDEMKDMMDDFKKRRKQ